MIIADKVCDQIDIRYILE